MSLQAKFNNVSGKPLVLLSPLDWGLGHTTRCVPVIQQLIYEGCEVIIACNSQQKTLLQAEFPSLSYHELPGYGIRYAKNRWITIGRLVWQLPKMIIRVKKEHRWLNRFLKKHPVDAIISDNRFGLYSKHIPSVFITHQLALKTGLGALADRQAMKQNYSMIGKFTEVWVPDNREGYSIAGTLAKPAVLPSIPVKYIGGISRFDPCLNEAASDATRIDLLIILSGPEPQRTIFEQLLTSQLGSFKGRVVMVRALPGSNRDTDNADRLNQLQQIADFTYYDHMPGAELNQLVCRAAMVISRSGYTTVMDLLKTKKKSILVPTPGQAEQEYLASYLEEQQLACTVRQQNFDLQQTLEKASRFPFRSFDDNMQQYKIAIKAFSATLK